MSVKCKTCYGHGANYGLVCPTCRGTGRELAPPSGSAMMRCLITGFDLEHSEITVQLPIGKTPHGLTLGDSILIEKEPNTGNK